MRAVPRVSSTLAVDQHEFDQARDLAPWRDGCEPSSREGVGRSETPDAERHPSMCKLTIERPPAREPWDPV